MNSRIALPLCCAILFSSLSVFSSSQQKGEAVIAGTFSSGLTPGGTPVGWRLQKISGRTRFAILNEGKDSVLRVDSKDSASGLLKQVEIDPKQYPVVGWRWKIERAIAAADEREKDKDDCAARVFVIFKDGLPKASRYSRLKHKLASAFSNAIPPGVAICYVWANGLKKDEVIESPYTDWVRIVAVESGAGKAGQWVTEERNVFEDFKKIFGVEPKQILGVALMTDTDNTKQSATSFYGDIVFKK
jgi:hypothetical protein